MKHEQELWEQIVLTYISANLAQFSSQDVAANAITCADAILAAHGTRFSLTRQPVYCGPSMPPYSQSK